MDNIFMMMILICVASALNVICRVLIPIAIAYDTKALSIRNDVMWIVLSIFFPVVIVLAYLLCRNSAQKNVPKLCTVCNTTVANGIKCCPTCNNTMFFVDYVVPNKDKLHKKSKTFAIVALICFIASIASSIAAMNYAINEIQPYGDDIIDKFSQEYEDEFGDFYSENPFEDFGE